MKRRFNNQRGAVMVIFTILLTVLVGFTALGTEVGRWYLVKSELSKAVDAAALIGAKNLSNPYVTVDTLAREVGNENFPAGQLNTPGSGQGSVSFGVTIVGNNKVQVVGDVSTNAFLTPLFGVERVATASLGVAQMNRVEIMMDLDKSGSMAGRPIDDLKSAALNFLNYFADTETDDKMGLITFATGVRVDHRLSTYFVNDMRAKINAMNSQTGKQQFTNAEDSIDRSDNQADGGFTDQTGLPGDQRVQQYLIFFSDGNPNTFRGTFTHNGRQYDAVAYTEGQYGSCTGYICGSDRNLCDPITGKSIAVPALPTGNGAAATSTRWGVFAQYPVPGYGPTDNVPENRLRPDWFKDVAQQMAIKHAQELKDKHIKIYTIGLGNIDRDFLSQIASGPEFEYYAPTSDELGAIFNAIAKDIKLRLVA